MDNKSLVELKTVWDIVNQYFPNENICYTRNILWSYTGYPGFWRGDPETCMRKQLKEAVEGIRQGKFFDLEHGWINEHTKPTRNKRIL